MDEAVVTRARALVGVPFRLHGRDRSTGVDCLGLVGHAYAARDLPTGYALRHAPDAALMAAVAARGFASLETAQPGALAVARLSAAQTHFGVWTGTSLIHACATIGRVVETPGPPGWPAIRWFARKGD